MNSAPQSTRERFDHLSSVLFSEISSSESLLTELYAEDTTFTRVNTSTVRQTGLVRNETLGIHLFRGKRSLYSTIVLQGDLQHDRQSAMQLLQELMNVIDSIPENPYCVHPAKQESSSTIEDGTLLPLEMVYDTLLAPVKQVDMTGLYTSGTIATGLRTSTGSSHWYETPSFIADFSIMGDKHRTTTFKYAGQHFDADTYRAQLDECMSTSRLQDELKEAPLSPGRYRAYLAPEAVAAVIGMFSWDGISERAIREGRSPLSACRTSDKKFSPQFSLSEQADIGKIAAYNDLGYRLPETLILIEDGELKQSLVSNETAAEFDIPSTNANKGEWLNAAVMQAGTLNKEAVLETLDSGLYISNVHYLNWSDPYSGRITGLNRHSCFLIEDGRHKACMPTMRFDDTLFSLFGSALEEISRDVSFFPNTSSYERRALGGKQCPGILVSGFEITL